jgi:hypothetical protein
MRRAALTVVGTGLSVLACTSGGANVAPSEPIQVAGAQFIAGPLPGVAPASVDGGAADAGAPTHLAIDDAVSRPFGPLLPGAAHQQFSGFATEDAVAIGVALANEGTGYWVVPVGQPNPQFPGEVNWDFFVDFNALDPPGRVKLRLVAIDAAGHAGTQAEVPLCIDSSIPDNGHACIPGQSPPAELISLQWDENFDLDLHVVTPDGVDLSAKPPIEADFDGGADGGGPAIDRDSLRGCVPDGYRQEDVLFGDPPTPGVYRLYAKPFAACGQMAVRFTITVFERAGTCPDCTLQAIYSQSGELLAVQAAGDTTPGLFVHEIQLPQSP